MTTVKRVSLFIFAVPRRVIRVDELAVLSDASLGLTQFC